MSNNARTPEELETLFEDALVLRDEVALGQLFDGGSTLVAHDGGTARGSGEIARLALATWNGNAAYVADPRSVVQARDIALIVAGQAINVVRRDRNGVWRYAIVFVDVQDGSKGDLNASRNDPSSNDEAGDSQPGRRRRTLVVR
jgi:hypothetical protein